MRRRYNPRPEDQPWHVQPVVRTPEQLAELERAHEAVREQEAARIASGVAYQRHVTTPNRSNDWP